jgi:hypothetical protein
MSKFIQDIIKTCEANVSEPKAKLIIKDLRAVVARYSENTSVDNPTMAELERQAAAIDTPVIEQDKPKLKPFVFSPSDFDGPLQQPQPAPPADSEIGAPETKAEPSSTEADIFALFSLGEKKAEAEFSLETFIEKAKALGTTYKGTPDTFAKAWQPFEKHARKTLGI